MADVIGSGIGAAKRMFITTGLPMLVGAFVVAVLMALFVGRAAAE